jgi:conjugal transfer pilin signal peptidase TrbI
MSAAASPSGRLVVALLGRRRAARWRAANRRAFNLSGRRRIIAIVGFGFYLAAALDAAAARWSLFVDPQSSRCLDGVVALLVDKDDHAVARGDIYAFVPPAEAALFFPPEMLFAKRVMGLPGDVVEVTLEATTVNGVVVAKGLALADMLGVSAARYLRRFTVPDGHLLMMGDTADSYDGRYWGVVPAANGVGRARVVL